MPSLIRPLVRWPFRRRWLARRLFGIQFGAIGPDDYYFDLVTPALVGRAARVLPAGATVLDLGAGAHAVVGLALWRQLGIPVVAAELDPRLARLAATAVERNSAPIPVIESCFFDELADCRFDTVIFNPPYVPPAAARALSLPETDRSQWDGGAAGFERIEAFLEALVDLERPVTTLLGVNRWFVAPERVLARTAALGGVEHCGLWRSRLWPADIHTLKNRVTGGSPRG